MKRSKFNEAQIAFILRQAEDGTPIGEVCRKAGIAEATLHNCRKKYAGLMPSEMKRLKLEDENGKLKRLVADLSLDKAMLQDVPQRKLLTVVDLFSRFSPVIDPAFSYRGSDVVETLEHVCQEVGYPKAIRVDQGSEFISKDLDLWAYQHDVTLDFSRPGKPTDNAFIESFNGSSARSV